MCWVIKLCVGAIGAIGLLAYSLFWASSFLDALMLNDCHRMVDALSYVWGEACGFNSGS